MAGKSRLVVLLSLFSIFALPTLTTALPSQLERKAGYCSTVSLQYAGPTGDWFIDWPSLKGTTEWCIMNEGAEGEGVKSVQRALNRCSTQFDDPNEDKLKVDGKYGPKTKAAIKYIQKIWKIKVDGIWGTDTGHEMYWEARMESPYTGNWEKACKKKYG